MVNENEVRERRGGEVLMKHLAKMNNEEAKAFDKSMQEKG